MKPPVKRILTIAALLVAAGVVGLMLRPSPLVVETGRVSSGRMRVSIEEEGKTRVRDRFVVSAPVTGRIDRIGLHEGDLVTQGAELVRIAPLPLDERARAEAEARLQAARAAERAARARVDRAVAALEQARRSHSRADQLEAKGMMALEEREQAELAEQTLARDLESARFAARASAFEVEAARSVLLAAGPDPAGRAAAAIVVRSPVAGTVLRVLQESERSVSAGTPLLEIGDPANLEIVLDLLSSEAVRVRPGAPMLLDGGDGRVLRARVRMVEPSAFTKVSALGVEEQRVNVIGDFIETPGRLADAYRVEASITVWEAADVLKAAGSALFRRGSGWSVFVIEDGRARRRDVEVGHRNAAEAEILRGLTAGQVLVLHPGQSIEDGSRVRPDRPKG